MPKSLIESTLSRRIPHKRQSGGITGYDFRLNLMYLHFSGARSSPLLKDQVSNLDESFESVSLEGLQIVLKNFKSSANIRNLQ